MPKKKSDFPYKEESYVAIQKWVLLLEKKLDRELTISEKNTINFIYFDLSFSEELLDYLIQCCIDLDKIYIYYIKVLALSWNNAAVQTPSQAKEYMKLKNLS